MQVDAFMAAIRTLLLDPEKARRMGAQGCHWISEHRSYDRLADQVATTYRRIAINDPSVISQ
jgi:glycosyltransferase involved in cell wall biosynthesis